ncbi:hypothetical protein [Nocardia sp. CNY236]|uniref:hypothetical protein n=1 Tax=Nocardia sp. CNY236 TaxID=1169152 RepID=UPI0003F6A55A|nr:hypothetical protein [Nocardia sp. CNY236]
MTGAAGFIVANYVHHVLKWEPNTRVVGIVDIDFARNTADLDPVIDRTAFEQADITDLEGYI